MMHERPWINHYDPGVPAEITFPRMQVYQFLEDAAKSIPEEACTIFQDQVVRYGEMNDLVDRLAAVGVEKGEPGGLLFA